MILRFFENLTFYGKCFICFGNKMDRPLSIKEARLEFVANKYEKPGARPVKSYSAKCGVIRQSTSLKVKRSDGLKESRGGIMFVTYKENMAALVDVAAAAQDKKIYSVSNAVMAYLIEGFFVITSSGEELPELRLGYASHYYRQDVSQLYYDMVTVGLVGDEFDPLVIPAPLVDDKYVIGILKGANAVPREEAYIRPSSPEAADMDKAQLWNELCLKLVFKDDMIRAVSRVIAPKRREELLREIEAVYAAAEPPTADDLLRQA